MGRVSVTWLVISFMLFIASVNGHPKTDSRLRSLETRFKRDSLALHEQIQELWETFESHTNGCTSVDTSSSISGGGTEVPSGKGNDVIETMQRLARELKVAFADEKRHLRQLLADMKKEMESQKQCVDATMSDAFATIAKGMLLLSKSVEDVNVKLDKIFDVSILRKEQLEALELIPSLEESVDRVKELTLAQMESEQRGNDAACAGEDGQYCDSRWTLPRSCADVQKGSSTNITSGVFTLYTRTHSPFSVFCVFREGHGYTYLSPTTSADVNINDLYDDRSHVLLRFTDRAGAQYESRLEQMTKYRHLPLSVQFNSHHGYNRVINSAMAPYLYVGLLPRRGIQHHRDVQGFKVNGYDVTFTNCDGNPNSYFVTLFNEALTKPKHNGGQSSVMNQLFNRATPVPAAHKIPPQYFSAFELHFGGCGGFASSAKYPHRPLAAIGIRYEIKCSIPAEVPHGKLLATNGNLFRSTVTYICDAGYKVIYGDVTRTCTASGHWSGALPICD